MEAITRSLQYCIEYIILLYCHTIIALCDRCNCNAHLVRRYYYSHDIITSYFIKYYLGTFTYHAHRLTEIVYVFLILMTV